MRTFAFGLLAVVVAAARNRGNDEEEVVEEEVVVVEEPPPCVCCRLLKDLDHGMRQLCLPPTDEEAETIAYHCNADEELDDCIVRLETEDSTANAAAINDLQVIQEAQGEREVEHDHEHDHEGESGAIKGLSTVAALATAIIFTAF